MATISSHVLNGMDGTHAGGVGIRLNNLSTGAVLFQSVTDVAGRLIETVELDQTTAEHRYEMVFATGAYWASLSDGKSKIGTMDEIALRFSMPDPSAKYHLPLILSQNACSAWWSQPG